MLNFAERTGCGAVILVWSFLTLGEASKYINTVQNYVRGWQEGPPVLQLLLLQACGSARSSAGQQTSSRRLCAPLAHIDRLSTESKSKANPRLQQSQAKVKVKILVDGKQSFKRKGGASASAANISAGGDSDGAGERKQHLRDISLSEPMTGKDRKRRRKHIEKSRERSRNDREQRKLGMEAKWSAGNRRYMYQASLLSGQREVRQSGIFERVASESTSLSLSLSYLVRILVVALHPGLNLGPAHAGNWLPATPDA